MQAVVLVGHGGPDQLHYRHDVPIPLPRVGELLILVRAAAINNMDINHRVGWYSPFVAESTAESATRRKWDREGDAWGISPMSFPRIQGSDVCGEVVAVGDNTLKSRIGERVIVQSCLRSLAIGNHDPWLGSEIDGGFAQFVRVPAADTYRVECALSDAQLAAVPCAYGTAENLLQRAHVRAGDRILVTGASGGVGLAAVILGRLRGANVVAVAGAKKVDAVRALGAELVIRRGANLVEALGPEQVDVVIDVVGGPSWTGVLGVLGRGGRYAIAGAIAGPIVEFDLRTLYLKDLTLLGCTSQHQDVFPKLVDLLERGTLYPVVAATYPLSAIAEAQRDFLAKRYVGKLVLIPPGVDHES